jgi:hypothetical protein|tara:strand:+ start:1520 stop:1681 length:162 start_codon:yes stop_codon:yes gene_type:complete
MWISEDESMMGCNLDHKTIKSLKDVNPLLLAKGIKDLVNAQKFEEEIRRVTND